MATTPKPPHLVISTLEHPPFVSREDPHNPDELSGFIPDIMVEIAKRAKFTYEWNLTKTFGMQKLNGWDGVMGEVVKGNADIGGAALTMTPEREEYADFSKPFFTDSVNLLVHKPTWYDMGIGYLSAPFSGDYWIVVLVALFLVGLVFFLIGKFSPYEWGNVGADKDPRGARNAFSLRNSYLFALSTLTWQGFREPPRSLSGRIMAAFWWIFVLFTVVAYTANLTAFFLARKERVPDMPFNSYADLLKSSHITTAVLRGGSTHQALRTSHSDTLRSLATLMDKRNSFEDSYQEAALRVKNADGNFVMMMEASSGLFYAKQECDLMVWGKDLFPSSMGFVMKKGSYWRTKFNAAINDLKSDGLLDQIKEKYWKFAGQCDHSDGREYLMNTGFMSKVPVYEITLKDMGIACIFFFLGCITAVVALIIEIIHYNVTKKGKKLHRPAVLKNPPKPSMPKIWKPKGKGKPKPPADIEEADETAGPFAAGPSSDEDALESVPLEDSPVEGDVEAAEGDPLVSGEPAEEKDLLQEQEQAKA